MVLWLLHDIIGTGDRSGDHKESDHQMYDHLVFLNKFERSHVEHVRRIGMTEAVILETGDTGTTLMYHDTPSSKLNASGALSLRDLRRRMCQLASRRPRQGRPFVNHRKIEMTSQDSKVPTANQSEGHAPESTTLGYRNAERTNDK